MNSIFFLTLSRRSSGKVTDVKNQEQCGSCWAFSATETIESAYMLKHNLVNSTMKPLAPQQMYVFLLLFILII